MDAGAMRVGARCSVAWQPGEVYTGVVREQGPDGRLLVAYDDGDQAWEQPEGVRLLEHLQAGGGGAATAHDSSHEAGSDMGDALALDLSDTDEGVAEVGDTLALDLSDTDEEVAEVGDALALELSDTDEEAAAKPKRRRLRKSAPAAAAGRNKRSSARRVDAPRPLSRRRHAATVVVLSSSSGDDTSSAASDGGSSGSDFEQEQVRAPKPSRQPSRKAAPKPLVPKQQTAIKVELLALEPASAATAASTADDRRKVAQPCRDLVVMDDLLGDSIRASPVDAPPPPQPQPASALSIASVSIAGFKSFREQVDVGLFSQFTCIVGPNGAGKSSVLDAICFVLGSKTSDLRGSNLSNLVNEELLHAGARGSGEQSVEAAVTVNLQAVDRSIAVGRRVIIPNASKPTAARSEYTLDGRKSSRTDIGKRLFSYGINIDMQSRFVLLQSRTVNIIRQGPDKLLDYLEEIIGTLEIRSQIDELRQQESAHRLQLDDVEAGINDIDSQRELLRPKVDAWKKYKSITAEYLARRTGLLLKNDIISAHRLEAAEDVRQELEREQAAYDEKATAFADEGQVQKDALTKTKRSAGSAKRRVAKAEATEQDCKVETRKLKVQNRCAQTNGTDASQALKDLTSKTEQLATSEERLHESESALSASVSELAVQLKATQVEKGSLSSENLKEMTALEGVLVKLQHQIKKNNPGRLAAQQKQAAARGTELDEIIQSEQKKRDKLAKAQTSALAELQESSSTKQDAASDRSRLEKELSDLERSTGQASTAVSQLKQLSQDSRAGRYRAAVSVLVRQHQGVCGLLCDLGGCQPQHEAAVNSVLGGALGVTVVVNTRRDGRYVTDYFREHRIGFVSCSILTEVKPIPGPTAAETLQQTAPQVLANLGDMIQCLPEYNLIWRRLSAGWCIAVDQPNAKTFSKHCNVVTTEGHLFKKDGEMRGSTQQSRDGCQHDVNALRVSSVSLQRSSLHAANSTSSMALPAQLAEAQNTLTATEGRANAKQAQLIAAGIQARQATAWEKQAKGSLTQVEKQLRASVSALAAAEQEHERMQSTRRCLQVALLELERSIADQDKTERRIERLLCPSGDLDELRALHEDADSKETQLKKQRDKIRQVQAEQRSLQKDMTKQQKKQQTSTSKQESLSSTLKELAVSQADAVQSKEQAVAAHTEATDAVSSLEGAVREQQNALKKMQTKNDKQRRGLEAAQLNEKSLQSQQRANSKDLQACYGEIQYDLLSKATAEANPELQLEAAGDSAKPLLLISAVHDELVRRLVHDDPDLDNEASEEQEEVAVLSKQQKNARKHVDMAAVAKDSALETRQDELNTKQEQAYVALETLGTKRESQQAQREGQFADGMKKVNSEAGRLYKDLSVHGDIYLSAPVSLDSNSLAEGVQMFCKETLISPEWKPVELLSGGQQALAALALTLGMSAVFPCPFYCVDEIDAALDTRAVAAVARVVQRLSSPAAPTAVPTERTLDQNDEATLMLEDVPLSATAGATPAAVPRSQFIVVSHRPQMYEKARRLIGVFTQGGEHHGASTACGWEPRSAAAATAAPHRKG